MDFSNFWWQAAAADDGGGDAGDAMGQSLRFRGSQDLGRTPNTPRSRDFIVSYWAKVTDINSAQRMWCFSAGNGDGISWDNTKGPRCFSLNKAGVTNSTGTLYTHVDPSAWYHVYVVGSSSANTVLYVNGVLQPHTFNNWFEDNIDWIGRRWSTNQNYNFVGYISHIHCVSGRQEPIDTFGRFNANGVWVPVDPKKDGDTAWYGANGFHLTFADPGDVGKDYSGNDNHFTATGFDTVGSGIGSIAYRELGLSTFTEAAQLGDEIGRVPVKPAFTTVSGEATLLVLDTPTKSIWFDFGFAAQNYRERVWVSNTGNDGDWVLAYNELQVGQQYVVTHTSEFKYCRRVYAGDGYGWIFPATEGILQPSDQVSLDYDIMQDSPTNNFATLNPIDTGIQTLSNANLTTQSYWNGWQTVGVSSGKWYGEATCVATPTTDFTYLQLGYNAGHFITSIAQYINTSYMSVVLTSTQLSGVVHDGASINLTATYSGPPSAYGAVAGDVFSWTIDLDVGTWTIFKNNVEVGKFENISWDEFAAFSVQVHNQGAAGTWSHNNGQQPFRYTPPAGFKALSTANMPAANLPDTITGTFTGNSNANGPFVYTGCIPARIQYGTIDVKYQDRLGQKNVDFLSNGFKVRSTTSNSGTVNYTVTTTHDGGEYDGNKVPFNLPAPAVSN